MKRFLKIPQEGIGTRRKKNIFVMPSRGSGTVIRGTDAVCNAPTSAGEVPGGI